MNDNKNVPAAFAQNAIDWTLIMTAFLLPILFYLRTYDSAMIKITLIQISGIVLAVFWVIKAVETGRLELPVPLARVVAPGLALLGWVLLSHRISPFKTGSMTGFINMTIFAVVYCLAAEQAGNPRFAERFTDWVLASGLVVSAYAVMQSLGVDPFIWKGAFGDRVFSTLGNPEILALFLATISPLALMRFAARSGDTAKMNLRMVGYGALLLLMTFSIGKTISFSGTCIFIAGNATIFCLSSLLTAERGKVVRAATLVLAGLALVMGFLNPPNYKKEMNFLRYTWAGTVKMIAKNPVFGSGAGTFFITYPEFRMPEIIKLEGKSNTETDHPQNELLEIWSDLGLVGLILFLWLFKNVFFTSFGAIKEALNNHEEEDALKLIGLLSAAITCFAGGMMSIALRFPAPGWLCWALFGILAGTAATYAKNNMKFYVYPFPVPAALVRILYLPVGYAAILLFCGSFNFFVSDIKHNFAIYYAKQQKLDLALNTFKEITPGSPVYIMSQYFAGNAYADKGDYEHAVKKYLEVKSLVPHYVQVDFKLGEAYFKEGDWQKALESFSQAYKLDPVFYYTYVRLAATYVKLGDVEKARKIYEDCSKLYSVVPFEKFIEDAR